MKEIAQNDFEKIKVNLFNIKTSEAMKQVADLSNQSILDTLSLDANDYTSMIKEQREMLMRYQEENDRLTEENRILNNKLLEVTT